MQLRVQFGKYYKIELLNPKINPDGSTPLMIWIADTVSIFSLRSGLQHWKALDLLIWSISLLTAE